MSCTCAGCVADRKIVDLEGEVQGYKKLVESAANEILELCDDVTARTLEIEKLRSLSVINFNGEVSRLKLEIDEMTVQRDQARRDAVIWKARCNTRVAEVEKTLVELQKEMVRQEREAFGKDEKAEKIVELEHRLARADTALMQAQRCFDENYNNLARRDVEIARLILQKKDIWQREKKE